jgi:HPt (histidine-containing phosphotransfer) domain-containing protein
VPDLIRDFLRDSSLRLASMDEAIQGGDPGALERLAHSLRGSASMLGGRRLEASCLALELAARESIPPDLGPLVSNVRAEFDSLRVELSALPPPSSAP